MSGASIWRAKTWSPYAAGALLGVVASVSMAGFGKRLSGAGAYQSLSGYVGKLAAPNSLYWKYVMNTGVTWEVWVLIGTFLGALLAAISSAELRLRLMPDTQWREVFGPSVWKRWLLVFFGTALIELAAGYAGGCTASLAISGGALLSPGAFVFMAGMFAGGIPVALWLYRRTPRL